jgi:ankyrin repeat protein
VEALELVLDAGANPSTPDIHGGYPIHYAAQMCGPNSEMGNDVRFGLAVLRKLLARGVEVNVRDKDGRQPILWAASAGWIMFIYSITKMLRNFITLILKVVLNEGMLKEFICLMIKLKVGLSDLNCPGTESLATLLKEIYSKNGQMCPYG